jgi:alginate O-acetyltransferase complex protein AlgJ
LKKILGCVDRISTNGGMFGWARGGTSAEPVRIDVVLRGEKIASTIPNIERQDLGGMFGYAIQLPPHISPLAFLSGDLRVLASIPSLKLTEELNPTPLVRKACIENLFQSKICKLSDADIVLLETMLSATRKGAPPPPSQASAISLGSDMAQTIVKHTEKLARAAPLPGVSDKTSAVNVPVGHISPDGTAMVGRDGHLFLVGGSNDVLAQQLSDPAAGYAAQDASSWLRLISRRMDICAEIGTRYLQIIIPEKLNVLPHLFPYAIPPKSPRLEQIETEIVGNPALAPSYVSGYAALSEAPASIRSCAFPKTDSHLTAEAYFFLYCHILNRMGLAAPDAPSFDEEALLVGDLSKRFFGISLYETTSYPAKAVRDALSASVRCVEHHDPENGHINSRYVWKNANARHPIKVIAFANSFFERGGDSRCLSWWFARTFAEFHFIWNPNLDHDYIRTHQPDWVIGQTIERFLPIIPRN